VGLTCYAYDIDGQRLSDHVRDEMVANMRGRVPAGIEISPSTLLADLMGRGELWVSEDGLPRRQVVDLEMPAVADEYDAQVRLVVDFRFPQLAEAKPAAPSVGATSRSWTGFRSGLAQLPVGEIISILIYLAIASALVAYRRQRYVYAAVAVTICILTVATPVLQAGEISLFFARRALAASAEPIAQALGLPAKPTSPCPGTRRWCIPRAAPG
jgi:hypothetical protein